MKANTVTVINVKSNDNIERIFGGYSPVAWDSSKNNTWIGCQDTFIFSLKNNTVQNSILSRVKNSTCAIYFGTSNNGVNFGNSLVTFSNDGQENGCSVCYSTYYEKPIANEESNRWQHYFVNEYEVFQIHKKFK